jgi:hypothetical protein
LPKVSIYSCLPAFSPFHLFTFSPFHLFTFSPFDLFTFSPFHLFTFSPFDLFTFSPFRLLASWKKHLVAAHYGLAQLNRSLFTLVASPMHALNKVQQLRWDAHDLESPGQ